MLIRGLIQVLALASFLHNERIDTKPIKGRTKDDGPYIPSSEIKKTDKTPIDIDTINDIKIKHTIDGSKGHDHQWELLVPDKKWENIKPIIIEVFKTPDFVKDERELTIHIKTIEEYIVEARYKLDANGKKRFSGA